MILAFLSINPEVLIKFVTSKLSMLAERGMFRILVTREDSPRLPGKGVVKYLVTTWATWHPVSNTDTAQLAVKCHL